MMNYPNQNISFKYFSVFLTNLFKAMNKTVSLGQLLIAVASFLLVLVGSWVAMSQRQTHTETSIVDMKNEMLELKIETKDAIRRIEDGQIRQGEKTDKIGDKIDELIEKKQDRQYIH